MASERIEIRYLHDRFSMFRMRVHADRDDVLSIVMVDCYRCPIAHAPPDVKSTIERYGLDALILSVRPREFHCKLLLNKASTELEKWRQESQQAQLFEIIQADLDPGLAQISDLRPAPNVAFRGRR
jgi:hypothetical protein